MGGISDNNWPAMAVEGRAGGAALERPTGGPTGPTPSQTLDIRALAHPYEESRLVLALATSTLVFGIAAIVAIWLGNLAAVIGAIAVVAFAAFFIWLSIQIFRAKLLGRAVRVSATQLPALGGVLDEVRRRLDYWKPVDVYVIDKHDNAATLVKFLGRPIILFEGSLVADLQPDENRGQLVFLIGRFLGALKARHRQLILIQVAIQAVDYLKLLQLFLAPYFRALEYSGDQIGHACCGDLRTTVAMMNRLLVGKELGPSLAADGVLDQALAVKSRILPRLAQLFMNEPHLTSRYLNVLCFAERFHAMALDDFRTQLGSAMDRRFAAAVARSPHRRPVSFGRRMTRNLIVAALVLGALLLVGIPLLRHPASTLLSTTTTTQPSTAPSETTPPQPSPTPPAAAEILRSHVPPAMRSNCQEIQPASNVATGATVALACSLTGSASPSQVQYVQYDTADSMNNAFNALAGAVPSGICRSEAGGVGPYTQSGSTAGMLACYPTQDGSHAIVWTKTSLNILSYAQDPSMSFAQLFEWWKNAVPG